MAEQANLLRHVPGKAFRIYRCKRSMHPARHYPKLTAWLADVMRDGLTRENRDRGHVLMVTIANRTGMPVTHRDGLP
jgi:hypothetical protein